jgi:predicted ATP-grasp superfamily ATP-dependent carboligase/CelD/BcsL family acetyltransferase involved in cellulose biosynthesis
MSLEVHHPRPAASETAAEERADPFFVIGTDRSGTTLLRLMLNEHPRLHIPRESGFVTDLMDTFPMDRPLSAAERRLAGEIVVRHWRWRDWQLPDDELRAALAGLEAADLARVVDRVFRAGAEHRAKTRWGDKTPAYVDDIARLHRLFPRARFLHIVRDGRDVCLSLKRLGWRGRTTMDIARYWSRAVSAALAAGRPLGPLYCELAYEDLVLDTERVLRRACDFLGEPFHDRMLRFHESAEREIADWETAIHAKLTRPPRASDVRRWEREMSRADLAIFEAIGGRTLQASGYTLRYRRSAPLQRAVAQVVFGAARAARQAGLMPEWRERRRPPRPPAASDEEAPRSGPPPWRWEVTSDRAGLDRHAVEWDALAHTRSSSLLSDAAWMREFVAAFLEGGQPVFLHLLRREGALIAALPLRRCGGLLPTWSVIANSHTPSLPLALDESLPEHYRRVLDHLLASASVIDLGRLATESPLGRGLLAAARRRGLRVACKKTRGEAILDLAGSWSLLRGSLSRGLRKNAERNERKLGQLGSLTLGVNEGAPSLARVLEECFELETAGWKGARGSPIKASASALRFYTGLAGAAASAGRLALYTLRLDGRLIAFEYCLRGQGQISLLKISFDPALAKYSPGQVLRLKILQRECERGEIAAYSMGPQSEWKLRWATRVEPVSKVRIYAPGPRGTIPYAVGPGLRAVLARSTVVRTLARRSREAWTAATRPAAAPPSPETVDRSARSVLDIHPRALRPERPPVMVLGGLSLVRALGRAGIPALLATSDPGDLSRRSRWVTGTCRIPEATGGDDEEVIEPLIRAGEELNRALGRKVPLFYANDDQLSLIYRHRRQLARHYLLLLNEPALALALLEKDRFEALARKHELPVPRSWSWSGHGDEALPGGPGAKVVKPRTKTGWKASAVRQRVLGEGKALVFDSAAELARLAAAGLSHELQVQDYVPGDDRCLFSFHGFADERGRLLAWFVGRKIRTFPAHTGESSFVELTRNDDLVRLGQELTGRLGLKGIFKMDFKQDPRDGRFYLLEINARFSLWNYLGAVNGMNLPAVAYDHLVFGKAEAPASYQTRYRWIKLPLDYKAFRQLQARGELGWTGWLGSILFGPTVHHRFAWDDPAPLVWGWAKRAWRRVGPARRRPAGSP